MFDIQLLKERIRFYRRSFGLTQTELAEKLRVSFQAVSNWETGNAVPDIGNLCALAGFFGVSLDDLLRREDDREQYLIGVDGGGTKSEFVLFASTGRVVKTFTLPGTNASTVGLERATQILSQGIDLCLKDQPGAGGIFIGNAGSLEGLRMELTQRYRQTPVRLAGDAVNAFYSSNADGTVICGTGSFVAVRDGEDIRSVGGWGYRLGDPGSAYNFGRAALRNAMFYEDGIREDGTLHFLLTKKMGVSQLRGALSGKSQAYIAALAPVVFEAYDQGCAEAEAIIEEEVEALARLVDAVLPNGGTVGVGGGIMGHFHQVLLPRLERHVKESIRFVVPNAPMVYGACVAACREFGVPQGPEFEEMFMNSYRILTASAKK